jgi:hypothetical protein
LAREFEADCVYGIGQEFAHGDRSVNRARRFCNRVPVDLREPCVAGVGGVVGLLRDSAPSRLALCRSVSSTYGRACAEAAADPGVGRQRRVTS